MLTRKAREVSRIDPLQWMGARMPISHANHPRIWPWEINRYPAHVWVPLALHHGKCHNNQWNFFSFFARFPVIIFFPRCLAPYYHYGSNYSLSASSVGFPIFFPLFLCIVFYWRCVNIFRSAESRILDLLRPRLVSFRSARPMGRRHWIKLTTCRVHS